jgi:hypothetical protein
VLAQAVLLGVFAAVVGAFLGVVAGLLAIRWWAASSHAMNAPGPVDIPVWEVLGVGACASVASLAAAYLPARGASRLDLIGVLRGQGVTARPVPRGLPVIGLVLAGIGGAVLAMNIANDGHEAGIAIGAIVLVVDRLAAGGDEDAAARQHVDLGVGQVEQVAGRAQVDDTDGGAPVMAVGAERRAAADRAVAGDDR